MLASKILNRTEHTISKYTRIISIIEYNEMFIITLNFYPLNMQQLPGVVKFIKASDIPGVNDWRPHGMVPANLKQEVRT